MPTMLTLQNNEIMRQHVGTLRTLGCLCKNILSGLGFRVLQKRPSTNEPSLNSDAYVTFFQGSRLVEGVSITWPSHLVCLRLMNVHVA